MGTQVHHKSYLAGYNPMRDLNDDSNGNSWHLLFGDNSLANGQYYTGFVPRAIADAHSGYDKNALKQKMIEHETIFKDQVNELHRIYRIQRDMMEEIKRNDLRIHRASIEPSSSSSILGSQAPSEDAWKWHVPSYPFVDSGYARSTVSGAEIINSPFSCTKGNNKLASRVPSQNGCTSKEFEASEARPSKVRKKLFDLQLPADEYIDTEDEQRDPKLSSTYSFTPDGEYKIASENSMKLFLGGVAGGKTGGQRDAFTSVSHLKSSVGLADLNEPAEVEETAAPSSINNLGHSSCNGRIECIDLSAKRNSGVLSPHKEVMQKPHRASHTGTPNNLSTENKGNEKEWFPHMYESGHSRGSFSSVSRGFQQEKRSLPSTLAEAHLPGIYLTDYRKEDLWKERAGRGVEATDRTRDYSNNNHLEPVLASQVPSQYPFMDSSDVSSTWPQFVSPWGKPADSLKQKLASFHSQPSLISSASLNKCLSSSVQNHGILGDKWHVNCISRLNPGLGCDPPSRNGFYLGSSSGSKDLPVCFSSVGFDHLNGRRSDNVASEHFINHQLEKSLKGSSYADMKPGKDMNLNVAFPKNSWNDAASQHDLEITEGKSKPEDGQAMLPWLCAKPACKSEVTNSRRDVNLHQASPDLLFGKTEAVNQVFNAPSALNNHEIKPKKEISEAQSVKKILGFPIFDNPSASEDKASSLVSSTAALHPTPEGAPAKQERQIRLIDINVACDASLLDSGDEPAADEMVVEKPLDQKAICVKNLIDLNSCITEDEDPPVPSVASNTAKVVLEIDLEAPAVPEAEEDILPEKENVQETVHQPPGQKTDQTVDEVIRIAAEAIVDISSSCQHINLDDSTCPPLDASLEESLLWFADVVTCSADKFRKKSGKEGSSEEMDDFEAMTLLLPETKEEDYMPKPFVPEGQNVEETETNLLPSRPRRGQARRGRQRRDFQRDILPGLASLSRHEVTEDLQTFGGLMRATGHTWNSGLTRRNGTRNGGTRGRRRAVVETTPAVPSAPCSPLVQQLSNIETGLPDRSLTGWGKTTRRPRRQRCPAGNPPTVAIT